jgi:hypothetical protein
MMMEVSRGDGERRPEKLLVAAVFRWLRRGWLTAKSDEQMVSGGAHDQMNEKGTS